MHLAVLGIAGAVLNLIGFAPYLRDILLHKTKPERIGFWIFFLLGAITFAAQVADGWSWSAALTGSSVLTSGTIAILSFRYGYGKFKMRDAISIVVALVGVAVWLLTNTPFIAVAMVILVDFSGFWLILVKSWEAPRTETLSAWLLSGIGAALAVLSVGRLDWTQLGYVAYSTVANLGLVCLLLYRRRAIQ